MMARVLKDYVEKQRQVGYSARIMALEFPNIDPVAFTIGPIDIRWYALSYMAGFLLGWYTIKISG